MAAEYSIVPLLGKDIRNMRKSQVKILTSGIRLFSEKGFHQTKTKEIAKLANVAEGTIFIYYKKKEDLFLAIINLVEKNLLELIEKNILLKLESSKNITSKICTKIILEEIKNCLEKNRVLLRAFLPELVYRTKIKRLIVKRTNEKLTNLIYELNVKLAKDNKEIIILDDNIKKELIYIIINVT